MTHPATCDQCGTVYRAGERGGHCRGGRFGGCCETFGSDTAATAHRVGPMKEVSEPRTQPPVDNRHLQAVIADLGRAARLP